MIALTKDTIVLGRNRKCFFTHATLILCLKRTRGGARIKS